MELANGQKSRVPQDEQSRWSRWEYVGIYTNRKETWTQYIKYGTGTEQDSGSHFNGD